MLVTEDTLRYLIEFYENDVFQSNVLPFELILSE